MRHSTGMPSVLHSNPTDRAIVDMYVIVLPAETDLALTADRKAPSLGLESPNENIRGLERVSSASTGDDAHCAVETHISITGGQAHVAAPDHLCRDVARTSIIDLTLGAGEGWSRRWRSRPRMSGSSRCRCR